MYRNVSIWIFLILLIVIINVYGGLHYFELPEDVSIEDFQN